MGAGPIIEALVICQSQKVLVLLTKDEILLTALVGIRVFKGKKNKSKLYVIGLSFNQYVIYRSC